MKQWEEYRIPAAEVRRISRIPITCLEDQTSVFSRMALEMTDKIEENNRQGKRTVFIIPFGPTGQYPVFVDLVNTRRISLTQVWLITMDDWLDSDGDLVGLDNIHSLRRKMNQVLYSKIDKSLLMPEEQRIYPDP
ncbi:MAG: glucosamine-6-phosphate isomerase, partial [Hungatella hathewayi]|nr:glucosamine-6-phosphate isomerase [Hungatella hathewayi]